VQKLLVRLLTACLLLMLTLGAGFILQVQLISSAPPWLLRSGPYALFAMGLLLSFGFNRARMFFALSAFALVHAALDISVLRGAGEARLVAMLAILLPLNLGLFSVSRERGIMSASGTVKIVFLLLQSIAVVSVLRFGEPHWLGWLEGDWLPQAMHGFGLAPAGMLSFCVIATGFAGFTLIRGRVEDYAFLIATVAAYAAFHQRTMSTAYTTNISAAAIVLAAAVIMVSYLMAYRDELTGLPGRRALNERLAALGRRYVIAMVDVDHFKKFNDKYGHEVGDQVLKMVAGQLRKVGGGGRAYRYGGEEFTVLFNATALAEALPHLEACRAAIAGYRMALRGVNRPKRDRRRARRPGRANPSESVSVTVSVGAAERSEQHASTERVLKAADAMLYRAKRLGRNRVVS